MEPRAQGGAELVIGAVVSKKWCARKENGVDDESHRGCQPRGHIIDEGTRRCCQHRACVDRDLHELYAMSKKSERPAEKDSTTVAAPIGAGPMSPAVVGVDEAVGVDDGDAGDGLVLG